MTQNSNPPKISKYVYLAFFASFLIFATCLFFAYQAGLLDWIFGYEMIVEDYDLSDDCKRIVTDVEDEVNKLGVCNQDEDCIASKEKQLGCPFDCYVIESSRVTGKKETYATINRNVRKYHLSCPPCEYECMSPPETNDLKCMQNQCVDSRWLD